MEEEDPPEQLSPGAAPEDPVDDAVPSYGRKAWEEAKALRKTPDEYHKERRAQEKQRHRERVAQTLAAREVELALLTPEERSAAEQREREAGWAGWQAKIDQGERVKDAFENGLRVVLDLSYNALMSEKQQKSLSRQIERCWGENRKAVAPVSLHLTGLAQCPPSCLPTAGTYKNWSTHNLEGNVEDHFDPSELVFLSPEADDVLTELDKSKVYVIGGLVDTSHHQCASLVMAKRVGAASARLPLQEHVPEVLSKRLPLNLVSVMFMLLTVNATGDWGLAVRQAVPLRKIRKPQEGKDAGQGTLQDGEEAGNDTVDVPS